MVRSKGGLLSLTARVVGVLVVAAVFAVVVAVVVVVQPRSWVSSTKLIYGNDSSSLLVDDQSGGSDPTRNLASQEQVVLSDGVIRPAASKLGISRQRLVDATKVAVLADSNVIEIAVRGSSARTAQQRSRVLASSYVSYLRSAARSTLATQADSLTSSITRLRTQLRSAARDDQGPLETALSSLVQRQDQLRAAASAETGDVQIISAASLPSRPSSPSTLVASGFGAGIGIVVGLMMLLVLSRIPHRRSQPTGSWSSAA